MDLQNILQYKNLTPLLVKSLQSDNIGFACCSDGNFSVFITLMVLLAIQIK